jgi:hypothetical protein
VSEIKPFRKELKFLVHHSVKRPLLERWKRYLVRAPFTNEHCVTPILSQYYDSPDLTFYHEKLDGLATRNKVRLRVYNQRFVEGDTAFLEIKHRAYDLVRKWRYKIPHFHPGWLDCSTWEFDDKGMESAFLALRERHRLRPSAQVYYQREAYEGAVEPDVRVTFDTALVGLHPGELLTRDLLFSRARSLMPDTLSILEVKSTRGLPRWLHEGVEAAELQQQTIPKYITAVEVLGLVELNASGVYA